ncbi:hypothetical protein [Desulfonema magnum]|uniref:hypothetical protein n=1 Tax=Desulfonema magnum TaxID=45655 RepID=UPI001A9B3D80|nr:hypothetical protein [Desulfonema magnum]
MPSYNIVAEEKSKKILTGAEILLENLFRRSEKNFHISPKKRNKNRISFRMSYRYLFHHLKAKLTLIWRKFLSPEPPQFSTPENVSSVMDRKGG